MSEDLTLSVDLTQVPDSVPQIGSGIYNFEIVDINVQAPKNTATQGKNVVVRLRVMDQGPFQGLQITDYIFVSTRADLTKEQRDRGLVPLRRLWQSAGLPVRQDGQLPLLELKGRAVRASVVKGTYTNEGRTKETSNIEKYFIPGDQEFPSAPPTGGSLQP